MPTVRRRDFLGPAHCDPERTDGVYFRRDEHDGFLYADARLTRTGVFVYADTEGNEWGELRTEGEVFDKAALRSFRLKTVTDDHPSDFVTAKNVKDVQIGTVGTDVRQDGRFVRASIVITDNTAIRSIEDGKIQLSCGYEADVIQDSGTAEGVPYVARQTKIRGNHLALVSQGRAGSDCAIGLGRGDAFSLFTERTPMKTKTIKVGDATYTVPEQVADALEAAQAETPPEPELVVAPTPPAPAPAVAVPAPAPVAAPTPAPAPAAVGDDVAALRARLDAVEVDRAGEPARFDARVDLVASAREVLGSSVVTTGVADSALMRQVIEAVRPGMGARLDANQAMPGYLQHAYEDALERHRVGEQNVRDTSGVVFGAHTVTDEERNAERQALRDSISAFHTGVPVEARAEG